MAPESSISHLLYGPGQGGLGGNSIVAGRLLDGYGGQQGTAGNWGNYSFTPGLHCLSDCDSPGGPIVPATTPVYSSLGSNPNELLTHTTGLFQQNRPILNELRNAQIPVNMNMNPVIALGKNSMFLAKTYRSITQDILAKAEGEFQRTIAFGYFPEQARHNARIVLEQSGITIETAQSLLAQIQAGSFHANASVTHLLREMSNSLKSSL